MTRLLNNPSRRDVMATIGAGGLTLAAGATRAFAADTIKVGLISPRTGPLGGFGQTDGYVLEHVRAALKNGVKIGGINCPAVWRCTPPGARNRAAAFVSEDLASPHRAIHD